MTKKKSSTKVNREFYRIDQAEFGADKVLGVKKCTKCKETKSLKDFQHGRGYVDGYYKHCRKCHYSEYGRPNYYLKTYGITQNEYELMVVAVGGRCPTCGSAHDPSKKNGRLVVDHCHTDKGIRGVLCDRCNVALGTVRDNVEVLRNLALYLERYYGT